MFLGRYEHSIDDKGRLTIPVRYRELIDHGAYITKGFNQNLMVLTSDHFLAMYKLIGGMNMADEDALHLRHMVLGNAQECEVDKAGRILISPLLRKEACLDGEAVIVGMGNFFEIWSRALWAEQESRLNDVETNKKRLKTINLSIQV